jgi:ATP-dependent helicase/DNAse subunit B
VSGIAPQDRGRFIHRVLQDIWHELKEYNGLRMALDNEAALRARVHSIADRLSQSQFSAPSPHHQKLVQIEVMVAVDVIMLLLQEESRRQPFTVQQNEQRELFDIAGLTLRIQPDRIDGLADGKQVLIDYKTGDAYRIKDWLDVDEPGRPRSPQLPLYALAHADQLSGIAYAVLAPGTAEIRGLADREGIANGISEYGKGRSRNKLHGVESWPQLLDHWRIVVNNLAEEFKQGRAEVNPLKNECTYCMLTGLCRIKEQQELDAEVEDE